MQLSSAPRQTFPPSFDRAMLLAERFESFCMAQVTPDGKVEIVEPNSGPSPVEAKVSLRDWLALIPPEDRKILRQRVKAALRTGNTAVCDYRILARDLTTRSVHMVLTPRFEGAKPCGFLAVITDLTGRRRSEANTELKRRLAEAWLRYSQDVFFFIDGDGKILEASAYATHRTGFARERFVGQPLSAFLQGEGAARTRLALTAAARTPSRFRSRFLTRLGYAMAVVLTIHPLRNEDEGELLAAVAVMHEVARRKDDTAVYDREVLELRRELAALRSEIDESFARSPDFLMILDVEGMIQRVNRAAAKAMKLRPGDLIGKAWFEGAPVTQRGGLAKRLQALTIGRAKKLRYEGRWQYDSGRTVSLAWVVRYSAKSSCYYASARDSTEKMEGEQAQVRCTKSGS